MNTKSDTPETDAAMHRADDVPAHAFVVDSYTARRIERERNELRERVAELESLDRGGWIRTTGWSNGLYHFDRSDNKDGTFALTVSENGGNRLVDIDHLTLADLECIVEIISDGIMRRREEELEANGGA